jgi:hypothetical protein
MGGQIMNIMMTFGWQLHHHDNRLNEVYVINDNDGP